MPHASITIRCPSCRGLSAVSPAAIGSPVECPYCAATFAAVPDVPVAKPLATKNIPVVFSPKKPVDVEIDSGHSLPETDRAVAFAAALLPLGIPLAWVALIAFGKWEPLFTPGVPIGLGIGATLLALGAAMTRDWSNGTRLKAAFAIVLLAYGVGAGLFFLKKEWAETVRKQFGKDEFGWVVHNAGTFQVKFPGRWRKDLDPLFSDWDLYSVGFFDPKLGGERYRATYGGEPDAIAKLPDDQWFEAIEQKLTTPETGVLKAIAKLDKQGFPGREYSFTRPDGATNLTLRVYRVSETIIALSAEGALLAADAKDVTTFFRSLYVNTR